MLNPGSSAARVRTLRALAFGALLLLSAAGGPRAGALPVALGERQATASTPSPQAPTAGYDWLQFGGDAQHSGNNTSETMLNAANVSRLRRQFVTSLPARVDGAATYLSGVPTPSGPRDLLFVTTVAGDILALDAHTGVQIWRHQYAAGSCMIVFTTTPCFTTSSPAIDPNRQYVYSYGLDGYVHKYRVGDGGEITGAGWPALTTLKRDVEKASSALTIVTAAGGTSYLYVTHGSYPTIYGDVGDYQGHITVINLADGSQHVYNAVCSDQAVHFVVAPGTPSCPEVGAGIWARGNVNYLPGTNRIYATTGNAAFDPTNHYWGDTTFALNPDGTGANGGPLDSYTPANYQYLMDWDLDLGSTAPALLPVPASTKYPHLGVQGGKDHQLRLLNLDDLSGQHGPGHTGGEVSVTPLPQDGEILTAPATWRNPVDNSIWLLIANDRGISGLQLAVDASGTPSLQTRWQKLNPSQGGTSPLVANGVLYYVGQNPGIQALNATTGAVLWQDTTIGGIHWQSPTVANGVLYVADESGRLIAYSLSRTAYYLPFVRR